METKTDHVQLGMEAYRQGDFKRALHHFNEVMQQSDQYADIYNLMGVIHQRSGNLLAARPAFEQALKINPDFEEARFNLLICLNELGENSHPDVAPDKFNDAPEPGELSKSVKGRLANMHRDIGQVYLDFGHFQQAEQQFVEALHLRPSFHDIRLTYGNSLRVQNKLEQAIEQYELILKQKPDYHLARTFLGLCHFLQGQKEEAERCWQQVLEADPEQKLAITYMSNLKADRV